MWGMLYMDVPTHLNARGPQWGKGDDCPGFYKEVRNYTTYIEEIIELLLLLLEDKYVLLQFYCKVLMFYLSQWTTMELN